MQIVNLGCIGCWTQLVLIRFQKSITIVYKKEKILNRKLTMIFIGKVFLLFIIICSFEPFQLYQLKCTFK